MPIIQIPTLESRQHIHGSMAWKVLITILLDWRESRTVRALCADKCFSHKHRATYSRRQKKRFLFFCRRVVVRSVPFPFYGAFYGYRLSKYGKRTVKVWCDNSKIMVKKRLKNSWIVSGSRHYAHTAHTA